MNDGNQTLDELEHRSTKRHDVDSYVNSTLHRLRSKAIGEFTTEDLRFMIAQEQGLRWLLPIALDRLDGDALVRGDMYSGDLLAALLQVPPSSWRNEPNSFDRLRRVVATLRSIPDELMHPLGEFHRSLAAANERFEVVAVNCAGITDRESFHDTFASLFGFPNWYGRNMDAWIDCMSCVRDSASGMRSKTTEPDGVLVLSLSDGTDLRSRCPEIFEALAVCVADVNERSVEAGELPTLALAP